MRPEMKLILMELNRIKMEMDELIEINLYTEENLLASRVGSKQMISSFCVSNSRTLLALG